MTLPVGLVTELGAWRFEGAALKDTLRLHLISALTSASPIFLLCATRSRFRDGDSLRRMVYFSLTSLALLSITITGHLGGILSGVE